MCFGVDAFANESLGAASRLAVARENQHVLSGVGRVVRALIAVGEHKRASALLDTTQLDAARPSDVADDARRRFDHCHIVAPVQLDLRRAGALLEQPAQIGETRLDLCRVADAHTRRAHILQDRLRRNLQLFACGAHFSERIREHILLHDTATHICIYVFSHLHIDHTLLFFFPTHRNDGMFHDIVVATIALKLGNIEFWRTIFGNERTFILYVVCV